VPDAATGGGSTVGTKTVDAGGSGVPTGAVVYRLGNEGRLDGNCGAPLLTSGGVDAPLTPPGGLGYKFKKSALKGKIIV